MDPTFDALYRPMGRLLRLAQTADPQRVVDTLSMTFAEVGGSDVVLFLADYQHTTLRPTPSTLVNGEAVASVPIEGSLAGRAFAVGRPQPVDRGDHWRVWIPVVERAQRLGVLAVSLEQWGPELEEFCIELGIAAAHIVVTADAYTDRWSQVRRSRHMSLAAEMQWALLPPLAFSVDGSTVAGLLEPAYEVAGDCFDYSLNGDVLDVAIFDAMGHGLHSSMLGALAVSAYRNSRRAQAVPDLRVTLTAVDAVIAGYARGEAFVTAVAAQLDITSGVLTWVSAGHPHPLHVRAGHVLSPVEAPAAPPLGLTAWADPGNHGHPVSVDLEPTDGVLLYTDGVVDSRNPRGEDFGEERLRDFLGRESVSQREPAETLRRLIHSVIEHNDAPLRDDATTVYLRWDFPAQIRR